MTFTDGEFKALQKKWYAKLKKAGFDDLEASGYLRQEKTGSRAGCMDAVRIAARAEYFRLAAQFYWSHTFDSRAEKEVWRLHANGETVRGIAHQCRIGRDRVHRIIRRVAVEMRMRTAQVVIRKYISDSDDAFIYSSWKRGEFYHQGEQTKEAWFEECERMLREGITYVACLSDDPDFIVGYSVFHNGEPEWLYIKKAYRHHGIEALLLSKNKENSRGTGSADTDRSETDEGTSERTPKAA